ncbi:2574_t:CDS:2, partial [Racocetra fulgida]
LGKDDDSNEEKQSTNEEIQDMVFSEEEILKIEEFFELPEINNADIENSIENED